MEIYGEIQDKTIRDRNDVLILDNYAEIILRNRNKDEIARGLISLDDVELIKEIKWHLRNDGYIGSNKPKNGTLLHRYIMNPQESKVVDHKNRNKLDCRRDNLRVCTQSENNKNSGMRKDNSSGVRGIRVNKGNAIRPYVAEIFVNNKKIHLGCYETLEEAEKVRRNAEIEYFGEFAIVLNGKNND
jgi:hypothetical protein